MLTYFIETKNKDGFSAMLYTCYDLIKPDVVLELAWRHGMTDFAMPYLINIIREYTQKVCSAVFISICSSSSHLASIG